MLEDPKIAQKKAYIFHFFFQDISQDLLDIIDLLNDTEEFLNKKSLFDENGLYSDDHHRKYNTSFPSILYKSIFLHQYYLLENCLNILCMQLFEVENYSISLNDFNGKGISRAIGYLKKVCSISNLTESKEWIAIKDFNKLRNCLVHNEGFISENQQDLLKVSKRQEKNDLGIFVTHDGHLINMNIEYCKFSNKIFDDFFKELQLNLRKSYNYDNAKI